MYSVFHEVSEITKQLQRARLEGAIRQKCRRLGLEVVVNRPGKTVTTTSELVIPKELPPIQEALKILAAEGTFGLISFKKRRGQGR